MKTVPLTIVTLVGFLITSVIGPLPLAQAYELYLPAPGVRVALSPEFSPAILKGITVHPENPLQFDFIVDKGDVRTQDLVSVRNEYTKLVKYFLASLTTPEKDLWVNLSPYEKNRIIPDVFGKTEMGRDLLGQDYLLKQITASLIYPEGEVGRKFWKKVYSQASKEFGTTDVPVNTFNKVWIIPDQATVYENGNTAYVLKSHLKVMLEQDYLAVAKNQMPTRGHVPEGAVSPSPMPSNEALNAKAPQVNNRSTNESASALGSQIVREIVLPQLENEVNRAKNFALLRQVNNSLILATWFKKRLKESVLGRIYVDRGKVKGVDQDPANNQEIYRRYLRAYKKGVFNYIKEDYDTLSQQTIPRKYFSGGYTTQQGNTNLEQRLDIEDNTTLKPGNKALLINAAKNSDQTEVATVDLTNPKAQENDATDRAMANPFNALLDLIRPHEFTPITIKYEHKRFLREELDNGSAKAWDKLAFGELVKAITDYKDSGKWKKEVNSEKRGVFQYSGEPMDIALGENGFYKELEFLAQWAEKCYFSEQQGKALQLLLIQDPNVQEEIVKLLRADIENLFEKFYKDKIDLPDLGISKQKKYSLRFNSFFTSTVVAETVATIATAVGVPLAAHLTLKYFNPWFDEESVKGAIEYAADIVLDLVLLDRLQERTEGHFVSKLKVLKDKALSDRVNRITPQSTQKDSEEFNAAFDGLYSYEAAVGEKSIYISALQRLSGYVMAGLRSETRFRRVGYNVVHAVAINEDQDSKNKRRKVTGKPLISSYAVIVSELRDIRDQNYEYFEALKAELVKEKEKIAKAGSNQRSAAGIFLEAIAQIEKERAIFDAEVEVAFKAYNDNLPKPLTEGLEIAAKKAELKASGNVDVAFLQGLFDHWIDDEKSELGADKKKDIIVSRFYFGALSRLWQIIDTNDNANPGYSDRLVLNTRKMVEILRIMLTREELKFGLTHHEINYMISTLEIALDTLNAITAFKKKFQGMSADAVDLMVGEKPVAFFSVTYSELVERGLRNLLDVYQYYRDYHPDIADILTRFSSGDKLSSGEMRVLSDTQLFEKEEEPELMVERPAALQYVVSHYDHLVKSNFQGAAEDFKDAAMKTEAKVSQVDVILGTYPYSIVNNGKKEKYQGDELWVFRPVFDKLSADIRTKLGKPGEVVIDQLSQKHTILGTSWHNENFAIVLRELLMNAMRAVGGKKDGKVQVIAAIEGDQFILSVVDNGVGLAKADKNKIFRMGFTTKKSAIANTVGKGLAYSQLFLRQAWKGSKIEAFDNKEDLNLRQAGATFRITIPRIVDIKETKDEAMNAGLQESIKTKISDGDVRSLDRLADRGSLLSAKDVFRSLGSSELKTAFARSIVAIREPDLPNNKIQDLVNTSGEGWIVFVDPAGQVIGRMYRSVSEDGSLYLGDLGVLSDYQGMKQNMSQTEKPRIGSFLLNYFLKQASSANRSVYIPAEGNSLGFYKKFLDTRGIHFSTERERYDDWTNIRISSENLRLPKFDSAMGSDFDKGGIDLNPANQKLVVQGKGNDFAFSDQLKDLDPDKIAGFFPIIVAIKNVQNLSKILGINEM